MLPLFKKFLLYLQAKNYSHETIYNYERDLKVFENFLKEINTEFEKINKITLVSYKKYLTSANRKTPAIRSGQKKLTSYSMNRMLSSIRAYLKYLINIGYKVSLYPEKVKLVKLIKTERKSSKVTELNNIIKLIESPTQLEKNKVVGLRNRAMLETLFSTSIRISELINLKRSQVSKTGQISVMKEREKNRSVYLTPRARRHLNNYLSKRNDDLAYLFIPYRGKNIKNSDRKISPNYLQEKIKMYREWLGISAPISADSLRYGFMLYLSKQETDPLIISNSYSHTSLNTTRYVHASDRYAEKTHRKYHPLKK